MPDPDELIERVRSAHDAFNRGDFDAAVEIIHPDVLVVRVGSEPDLQGVQAVRQWMEPDALEDQAFEITGVEAVDSRVLVRTRVTARGAGSGVEVAVNAINVWTFDDSGKVVRIAAFFEHEEDEARRALRGDRN